MIGLLKRVARKVCRRIGLYDTVKIVHVERYAVVETDKLAGKNILVTGGSSGIGLAIAKKCLDSGANVIITGRDESKLRHVLNEDVTGRLQVMVWDVIDFNVLQLKMDDVFRLFDGRLDVLVCNAGISIRQEVGTFTFNVWDAILATNLKAPVFILQAVSNKWRDQGVGGVILNISSMAGVEPAVDAYSAAKCALSSITQGVARSLAPLGIRVNAIAPGVVIGTNLRAFQRSISPSGNVRCNWIPAGRYGVPEEIAELAVFLVSDQAAYITGSVIVCDGAGALRQ